MCNCIDKLEEQLTEKMLEEYPESEGWEIIETVEFQNKMILFRGNDKSDIVLQNETLGKVKKNKRIRKFTLSVQPNYCPYCGKKYE